MPTATKEPDAIAAWKNATTTEDRQRSWDKASNDVAEDAIERQLHNKPSRPKVRFEVTAHHAMKMAKKVVMAVDESEAWALFCDANRKWPNRRTAQPKFKKLGE